MPKRANMNGTAGGALVQVARVYLRVSTDEQDLQRQEAIITAARAAGYYVAGVYREKASGARADRPELLRMVADLPLRGGGGGGGGVGPAPRVRAWPCPAWSICLSWRPAPRASRASCWSRYRTCCCASRSKSRPTTTTILAPP